MILLFCVVWSSICLAENIEYEIKERDGDRYMLFVATLSNILFFLFPDDLVPAFFTITFVNIVSTCPFYIIRKLDWIYGMMKSLTYLGCIIWLIAFN